MKQGQIFQQYIWIINTLRASRGMTLEALNERWKDEKVADGNPLPRTTFNRHRTAILDMFGIVIECEPRTYKYYICNPEVMNGDDIGKWLFSTLTVHGVLADSAAIKDRFVLEDVPAGLEFLPTIIAAIKTNRRVRMGYQKFGQEGYVKTVCPYAQKLFHQRWYMLARTADDQMRIYALDRMTMAELTDETFEMPADFSPKDYFSDYYGVLADGTPLTYVVVRAHRWTPNYLRTLPLHHSQREIATGDDYADFAYNIRPTADFLGQLLSHGDGIEVLEPIGLREKMKQLITASLSRY